MTLPTPIQFLQTATERRAGAVTTAEDMYAAYQAFCEARGLEVFSATKFGLSLAEAGLIKGRSGAARKTVYFGVLTLPETSLTNLGANASLNEASNPVANCVANPVTPPSNPVATMSELQKDTVEGAKRHSLEAQNPVANPVATVSFASPDTVQTMSFSQNDRVSTMSPPKNDTVATQLDALATQLPAILKAVEALPLLEAAREYATAGIPIFPCQPGKKQPATAHGFKSASLDVTGWPEGGNIGLPLSGYIYVLDVDGDAGWESLRKMPALPETLTVLTGAKRGQARGAHYYFASTTTQRSRKIAPGLETRGLGAYVLAPPSIHPCGLKYELEASSADTIAIAPDWVTVTPAKATPPPPPPPESSPRALTRAAKFVAKYTRLAAANGNRNNYGADLAMQLRDLSLPISAAEPLMRQYQESVQGIGDHEYKWAEAQATLRSIFTTGARPAPASPNAPPPPPPEPGVDPCKALKIRPLGYDLQTFYYFPQITKQVIGLTAQNHRKLNLLAMSDDETTWRRYFAHKQQGWSHESAAAHLMRACKERGIFTDALRRGRGAWRDPDAIALHLGNRVVYNGKEHDLLTVPGRAVYEACAALPYGEPMSDNVARGIFETSMRLSWLNRFFGVLMSGWIVLAPVCGALDWRPHIWLTGNKGSGKTTLLKKFIMPLTGGWSHLYEGGSTEAGIRQSLKRDALPVILDEAEGEDEKQWQRLQAILQLCRSSSSQSGAQTVKGSAGSAPIQFEIRSMFCFSSIGVPLVQDADESRVAVLTLGPQLPPAEWATISAHLDTFTPELGRALIARTVSILPSILINARKFSSLLSEHLGSSRAGDQYGTLVAGAASLKYPREMTGPEVFDFIKAYNISELVEDVEQSDEWRCLHAILQHIVRINESNRREARSLGELLDEACRHTGGDTAREYLMRHGLKVDKRNRALMISGSHIQLYSILRGTPWAYGWARILARIDGAKRMESAQRFGAGGMHRCVAIPLRLILPSEGDTLPMSLESDNFTPKEDEA